MATTTTNFGWDIPQSTDLVKDGATAIAALGQDIDTAFIDLKGGTTGQVLAKASGTDLDFSWVAQDDSNAIQNAIVDAKGDLIAATAADTPARLAVGTNGHVLTADSTAATGLKWAAAAGGGKVLQVIQDTVTALVINSTTSYTDTGLDVTITPSANTSKILIIANLNGLGKGTGNVNNGVNLQVIRGASSIYVGGQGQSYSAAAANNLTASTLVYLDSPATTSATTYKVQFSSTVSGQAATLNDYRTSDTVVSSIVVMEIGA